MAVAWSMKERSQVSEGELTCGLAAKEGVREPREERGLESSPEELLRFDQNLEPENSKEV